LDVLPQLQKDYIETGKILFVFKDFPIPNHQYAQKASEATYCAGEQNEDSFWDLHVKLFQNQTNLTKEDLIKYAGEFELNVQAFTTCIESDRYKNLVLRNRQDGLKAGVNATPSILINDVKLAGLQPYENIVKIIETELKN
jgi:protein-disulfide isomerase